jgi:isocitrate lyase
MRKYKIALIREGGQDMIIFIMQPSFGLKTNEDQESTMEHLQREASDAAFPGRVVAIWQARNRTYFRAPLLWHAYFRTPKIYAFVLANANAELTLNL